ncbi:MULTISPECIES: TetR/AcrR family transcriptional regulator [Bacillus cereus group]|uniref:TetR/AcrR family transcriptional regulator n=1 Tax=Bacillus cereus group TaxID=86661 RepID=UPI000BEC488F|nr:MULTISPECIES: TetR/AcrR family transcriptional regulator [Bacillus cereus group]PDY20908.1 TetR family transcriptional regulator [Bacillus cereus]PDY74399.1 TetR family transcriptional regulator [Bacillus cereus]PEB96836.1 TetR family transcriptional regulator [Bacillus cereus]PEC02901.1 TetR family transcriptional regulator [Bacillus cereus]PEC24223.1 TetR family transcriptional regulator [Bacillus thuringiensis]
MPLIVDREQVRHEILHALQQCLEEKPLLKVSMRDIAAKAKIAHSKINYYFNTKEKLLLAYIEFFAISYKMGIEHWYIKYKQNNANLNESSQTIVKHFIKDMVLISHQKQSWAFTQISTMGQYNMEIRSAIKNVYNDWRESIKRVLEEVYRGKDDHMVYKAEAVLIIIDGLLIYSLHEKIDESRIDAVLANITL